MYGYMNEGSIAYRMCPYKYANLLSNFNICNNLFIKNVTHWKKLQVSHTDNDIIIDTNKHKLHLSILYSNLNITYIVRGLKIEILRHFIKIY